MKNKKLIGCLLIGLLTFSLVGCGNKVKVAKEDAFTTIPEQKLVTDYLVENLKNNDEFFKDGKTFSDLYFGGLNDTDLISKYSLNVEKGKVYSKKESYNINSKLFNLSQNFIMSNNGGNPVTLAKKDLLPQIQNYLSDVWENKKDGDYSLSPEFKEKNSKEYFQKYLKENKIEITKITYPDTAKQFTRLAGCNVSTVIITIEGTQNKKAFTKELGLDFYFVAPVVVREGNIPDSNTETLEIMGVSISTENADSLIHYKLNVEETLKNFGVE